MRVGLGGYVGWLGVVGWLGEVGGGWVVEWAGVCSNLLAVGP